jgi:hypothetical protein
MPQLPLVWENGRSELETSRGDTGRTRPNAENKQKIAAPLHKSSRGNSTVKEGGL